jgi:transposase
MFLLLAGTLAGSIIIAALISCSWWMVRDVKLRRTRAAACARSAAAAMIPVPSCVRVWLSVGRTDMRRGMNGLALQVQETLGRGPFVGDLFVFRGARADLIKILWQDGRNQHATWFGPSIAPT